MSVCRSPLDAVAGLQTSCRTGLILLLSAGSVMLFCFLMLISRGELRQHAVFCVAVFGAAFIVYAAALLLLRVFDDACDPGSERFRLIIILLFALAFRIILLASPPSLSDDIYRYVWEGRLVSCGINPFTCAPEDDALIPLRDTVIYPHINHRHLSTIYPPLALIIFSLAARLQATIFTMNAVFLGFDLLTILVLLVTLRCLHLKVSRIILYAWNPLVIVEFAGSGHVDSAGIFFLMLALYLFTRRQHSACVIGLAAAFLNKFIPFVFLLLLPLRKPRVSAAVFIAVVITAYLPFLDAGCGLFHTLSIYSRTWIFNASAYEALQWLLPSPDAARITAGAVFVTCVVLIILLRKKIYAVLGGQAPYFIGLVVFGVLFAVSPVVHPWYICWIIPFAVIYPCMTAVLLSGTVFVSYLVLQQYVATGVWQESTTVRLTVYAPVYLLLILETAQRQPAFLAHRMKAAVRQKYVTGSTWS